MRAGESSPSHSRPLHALNRAGGFRRRPCPLTPVGDAVRAPIARSALDSPKRSSAHIAGRQQRRRALPNPAPQRSRAPTPPAPAGLRLALRHRPRPSTWLVASPSTSAERQFNWTEALSIGTGVSRAEIGRRDGSRALHLAGHVPGVSRGVLGGTAALARFAWSIRMMILATSGRWANAAIVRASTAAVV